MRGLFSVGRSWVGFKGRVCFDRKVVFLDVVVVSDFGNGTCLFRERRSKRAGRCRSRFRSPPDRDNALQTGDPARTTVLACIARTQACKAVRIMRNLRRGVYASAHARPAMSARETMRCFVAQDPLRRVRVRFQRAGCSSFQKFEIPALGLV
jgi:hypothetical protein